MDQKSFINKEAYVQHGENIEKACPKIENIFVTV